MESLDIVVVPVHTTMSSFPLLISPAIILYHQVGGIRILLIVVIQWRKEVFVRGGYDS